MDEPKDQRLILHLTASQMENVRGYQHREWIGSTSEAMRQLLELGLIAAGVVDAQAVKPEVQLPAPAIPAITPEFRSWLADMVFPFLRQQGKREYDLVEVLDGAFDPKDKGQHPVGRDKAVIKLFQLMGWSVKTERKGGVTKRMVRAPAEA